MRVREIGALSPKRIAFIKPSPQERGSSAEGVCVWKDTQRKSLLQTQDGTYRSTGQWKQAQDLHML